jgi:hypothetical protein
MLMKMKTTMFKRIFAIGLGLTFFSQSCTNLDEELFSDVTSDNFFKTDEEFIAALGQAYSSFGGMGNHSSLWTLHELASDELVVTTKGGDWYDGGVLIQVHEHVPSPGNDFVNNTWNFLFGGVNTCNRLIFQFEELNAPGSDAFIAELRALRALWYYWLLDTYGNVPIVTDFTATDPPATKPRSEVYAFVVSELNAVKDALPEAVDGTTYGRITKWGAYAILAKVYLNAGVYTGTAKWAEAVTAADVVINSGKYNLETSYKANFAVNNQGSRENIFVVPYDKVFAGGFNWPMMTLHYASQGVFNFTMQPWNGYSTMEEFYNSYIDPVRNPGPQGPAYRGGQTKNFVDGTFAPLPGDVGTQDDRLSNFLVGPQIKPDGNPATDPGFEVTKDPDGTVLNFTPYVNEIYPGGLRQAGARIGKYQYEQGGTNNMSNDFVVLRYADILLTKAEALWRQNAADATALSLVNQIRARAGVDPYADLTDWPTSPTPDNTIYQSKILSERGREMFAELVRRQDLIRFGKFGEKWWEKDASAASKQLFPIPISQINANPNLTQNPGY